MPTEYLLLFKVVDLGVTAVLIVAIWRLVDKWAGSFLETQKKHVAAMQEVAAGVGASRGEQQDLILAVRVLASKIDEQRGWLKQLDEDLRGGKVSR